MAKTEVYSWRLTPQLKSDLEKAARAERKSLSELLEQIAREWLERSREENEDDREEQEQIRARAMKFIGSLEGGDPHLSERVSAEVRARLARRYGR
jgi:single-stranded DNA-specific DHH superfamily exonuclease